MKKQKVITVIGGVCALLVMFAGCSGKSGEKEYGKAMASLKEGDLVRAQSQLEKVIRKSSSNDMKAKANNQLGIILWELNRQEQAIKRFAEACRLTEGISGADLNLGMALCVAGETDQAEFQLTKILNEQPANSVANTYMGLAQMKKKEWRKASDELAKGLQSNPKDAAGQNAFALVELHLNNSDAAINRLKQLVAAYPDYAPAAYNLAVIYDQWLGNKSAALGWYKQYLAKAGDAGAQSAHAKTAIARLGGEVTTQTQAPSNIGTDASVNWIAEGTKFHSAKKYEEAVAAFKKAILANPSQKTAFYNMGLSLYEMAKYANATDAFSNALKIDPAFANARYMLALSYVKQSKWKDAEREAKLLGKLDPEKSESLLKFISSAR